MLFGRKRIGTMHLASFPFLLYLLLRGVLKSQGALLLYIIPIGLLAGIGSGIIFYRFYLQRLKGDTINLKGYSFPHITILIIIAFISLPILGIFHILVEFELIQERIAKLIYDPGLLLFASYLLSCFLSSIIVEFILLFRWEKKHNIKLYADFGGFWTVG
jgi:hypothetical protein